MAVYCNRFLYDATATCHSVTEPIVVWYLSHIGNHWEELSRKEWAHKRIKEQPFFGEVN